MIFSMNFDQFNYYKNKLNIKKIIIIIMKTITSPKIN